MHGLSTQKEDWKTDHSLEVKKQLKVYFWHPISNWRVPYSISIDFKDVSQVCSISESHYVPSKDFLSWHRKLPVSSLQSAVPSSVSTNDQKSPSALQKDWEHPIRSLLCSDLSKWRQRMVKPGCPTTALLLQVSYDFCAHSKNNVCDVKVKSLYMSLLSVLI